MVQATEMWVCQTGDCRTPERQIRGAPRQCVALKTRCQTIDLSGIMLVAAERAFVRDALGVTIGKLREALSLRANATRRIEQAALSYREQRPLSRRRRARRGRRSMQRGFSDRTVSDEPREPIRGLAPSSTGGRRLAAHLTMALTMDIRGYPRLNP
jgi:hypothetical protein